MSGSQTRSLILQKAIELASLRGLEQLSLGKLANEVGMSKSGLFAHFESKEALQLAAIDHGWEVFEEKVLHSGAGEPERGLDALLERWLSFYDSDVLPGGCFFITAAVEFAADRGPVRDALADALRQERELLENAIAEAREAGDVPSERDVSQLAFELHSILLTTNALLHVHRDEAVLDHARAAFPRVLGQSGTSAAG